MEESVCARKRKKEVIMSLPLIGIAIGLVLGIVWVAFGFGAALLTGFLALVG